jgi:hypothetical protein
VTSFDSKKDDKSIVGAHLVDASPRETMLSPPASTTGDMKLSFDNQLSPDTQETSKHGASPSADKEKLDKKKDKSSKKQGKKEKKEKEKEKEESEEKQLYIEDMYEIQHSRLIFNDKKKNQRVMKLNIPKQPRAPS